MSQRIGAMVGPVGFIMVLLLGQFHVWWFATAWRPFLLVAIFAAIAVEALYYFSLFKSGQSEERVNYRIVLSVVALSIVLDEPLRDFGGIDEYFIGAALQHIIFFFFMPRWLRGSMGPRLSYAASGGIYCIFHLPNMPLTGITLFAGIVFAYCYQRYGTKLFPLMVVLHYIGGSILHGVYHLNLRVGALKMPLVKFLGL